MPSVETEKINQILNDPEQLKIAAPYRLAAFTLYYLAHYIKSDVPEFHKEIYEDLENDALKLLEIVAFRGSAKSTIASLAYPLWCAIFAKRNFIILLSDTFTQSKQIISNIIYELEHNELIRRDFGDFKTKDEDWTATNIFLKGSVRIMSRSRGQKIRGLRHLQYRADLIIGDDIENIEVVRMKEQRDKTEEWLVSDVIPALDPKIGKLVLIGNKLHLDGIYERMRAKIKQGQHGVYKEFGLFDKEGKNRWEAEYSPERIKQIRIDVGSRYFKREYLLEVVASDDQTIKNIVYYEKLPKLVKIAIGVDLAISQKETADYTSINAAAKGDDGKFYNLKNVYGRWNFNETLERIDTFYKELKTQYPNIPVILGVEDVAYQKAAIEEIQRRYRIKVEAIKQTTDKRARLETLIPYFENDQVLFKQKGMEDLIDQILNFGIEQYDDCVDAFEISMRQLIINSTPRIRWL